MGFQFTPYIVVMLSAAVVCFLIGCYAWRRRDIPVDTALIFIMMTAITEWLVASALGYATNDPSSKIIWAKIEYIGVVSVPLLVLIFAVNYSGLKHRLTTRNLILIALVPAITLLLTWTNEMHGLIWSRYIPYQENGVMFSDKTYGLWFWIYWIYSYLLLLAATVLIIRTALASSKAFMGQAVVLIFGILVPWVGNAIYVLHISPLGNLDLTPLSFAFTGIVLSLGIMRWHLFDIKPTAQVAVIENLADGLILLNNRNRIIDINPAARHIFRVSAEETIGKDGLTILPAEVFSDELRDNDGKIRLEMKLPYDGRERHYELTGTPFYDKRGDLIGRIIIVHDTTELKLMNKELEAFSYSISHDLLAPLRSIDGFSQALLQEYPDKLDEQGKNYLQRVRANTQRMGELIDDLLKLSRLTRSEMKLEMVDLSTLAQSIATELQKTGPERQVEFVITPGLSAKGDSHLLRLLLENLLGNAWKFTGKLSQARIELGATQVDGKQAFFVRDDGAGFDMTYADKLFAPFQRLHSASEFPGIGIGLATVQRIVHRHGGRVWAEGEIEKGATFYFTLGEIKKWE